MLFEVDLYTEESGETIQKFLNTQIMPTVTDLEKLALSVSRYKPSFTKAVFRRNLSYLEEEFREVSKNFLSLYYIYKNPDKLFADLKLDPQKDKEKIKKLNEDYKTSRFVVIDHLDRGFRLMEMVERQLDRYHRSADQRLAVVLSIIAITASVVTLIIRF